MTARTETELAEVRRTRRHPVRSQPDYLILRYLVNHLARVLSEIRHPVDDVLDVWCGTQPYRDLLPPHLRYVSLDVTDEFGAPDVLSDEFLPFPDDSFDLVLSTEAFYYHPDPEHAVRELRRVLRPGGTVVLTVPLVWEYDRRIVERRYTGPHLAQLFEGWDGVQVWENGGYAVAWATLTGRIISRLQWVLPARARRLLAPLLPAVYVAMNVLATGLAKGEARWYHGPYVLPMGLLLTARRPA